MVKRDMKGPGVHSEEVDSYNADTELTEGIV